MNTELAGQTSRPCPHCHKLVAIKALLVGNTRVQLDCDHVFTLDEWYEIPKEKSCECDEAGYPPGILFPTGHSGEHGEFESEDGRVFVVRHDACELFSSDLHASVFVSRLMKKPLRFFLEPGNEPFGYYYIDCTIAEAVAFCDSLRKA